MPDDRKGVRPSHVDFVAIGGTGMGALAGLCKRRGLGVTGSDTKLYPPMSTKLAAWGIEALDRRRLKGLESVALVAAPDDVDDMHSPTHVERKEIAGALNGK